MNQVYQKFLNLFLANKRKINLLRYILEIYGGYQILNHLIPYIKKYMYQNLKKLPTVQKMIETKSNAIIEEIRDELNTEVKDLQSVHQLNEEGWTSEQIEAEFEKMKPLQSFNYQEGKVSGAVYGYNKKLNYLLHKLYPYFCQSNSLHTNLFPSIRKMEIDIIKIMANLFNGSPEVGGTFTSGGTESILLSCKAYRDKAYEEGIENPNMIMSDTAHCAFIKAAKYFKIELRIIPSQKDYTYDLLELKKNIDSNTVLVIGSAPNYNLGLIDPIQELSDICFPRNIGLHVDCCMGAFLVNFSEEIVDFRIEGVTSISTDLHKYGLTPKGSSVTLYRNRHLLKHQYFIDETWSGGVYATSTIAGSKNGNMVALSWATLMFKGLQGYRDSYHKIGEVTRYLKEKINLIPGLMVYGNPELNIVGIGSSELNINILGDRLNNKGWKINMIQNPGGFHFCITCFHTKEIIDNFMSDLESLIPNLPDSNTESKCIYGTMKSVNDNDIIKDVITDYLHVVNGY